MAKHLLIMRHGKSDWSNNEEDFDRPLNNRGRKNVATIAQRLVSLDIIPDRVVSSAAVRTKQTTEIVLDNIQSKQTNTQYLEQLYLADMYKVLEVIDQNLQQTSRNLMIIAHNPGLDNIVSYLSSEPPPRNITGKLMTTAALAIFELDETSSIKGNQLSLKYMLRPKELD